MGDVVDAAAGEVARAAEGTAEAEDIGAAAADMREGVDADEEAEDGAAPARADKRVVAPPGRGRLPAAATPAPPLPMASLSRDTERAPSMAASSSLIIPVDL